MTPAEELELLKLRKRKLELESTTGQPGESEGSDDGEGELTPAPSKAGETAFDAIQGGTRGVTLGLNDVVAGLGAAAGDLFQSTVDGRPRNPDAYREGVEEERKRDAASQERSPRAFKRAELAGVVATAPLVAAKPVQLAARSASGAPIALGAVADAAAPALTRYGRAAATGALTGLGLGDVDNLEDVPGAAATGAALGLGGEALSTAVRSGMATGIGPSDLVRTGSLKGADALKALIGKADDAPIVRGALALPTGGASEAALLSARGAEKALRRIGTEVVPPPPPAPVFAPTATAPVDDAMAAGLPTAKPNPLAALVDEPMPTMPARNPRTPLDQIPKAAPAPAADPLDDLVTARTPAASQALPEQMTSVVPVVTRNSSAGNIAKAVEAKAIELGTTDLATIANALKLPTTLVSDPLKNAVSRFAFREAVKGAGTKAPAVVDDVGAALDDIAKDGQQMPMEALAAIRQAKIETPRSLLPGDRPMAQVAAANQGAEMAAAYQALQPTQRPGFISFLRSQGYSDEKIRTMLGITMKRWRQESFNR